MRGVDVMLGWPQLGDADLVHRHIGATTFCVCAAPSYWARHGKPRHPRDLEEHDCLTIRGNYGKVMDLWSFRRGEERVDVTARGWLLTDNVHRDAVLAVASAGGGVVRVVDWTQRPGQEMSRGELEPVLTDWLLTEVAAGQPSTCLTARARGACCVCACTSTS